MPAAMGVQAAKPGHLVVDIDGDGSILMNIQELATLYCEDLPVKVLLLNNQHLGMVVQWEDRFMEGRRGHTYLGHINDPEAVGEGSGPIGKTYPDFVKIADAHGLPGIHVSTREESAAAIRHARASAGPVLIDFHVQQEDAVYPMVAPGAALHEMIDAPSSLAESGADRL